MLVKTILSVIALSGTPSDSAEQVNASSLVGNAQVVVSSTVDSLERTGVKKVRIYEERTGVKKVRISEERTGVKKVRI